MQNVTMILEGGATRGVFTSGVLDFLMEKEWYPSHVIGVSAGSCNAVDYVSKQPGRTRDCMIPTDKNGKYIYGFRKFVKEKSLMNMDLIFDEYPNRIYPFDFDTFFESEITCEIVTTNCQNGQAEYMQEHRDRERLMRLCRASSSMPLITPIVNIDGVPYLDGGLADSVPIEHALEIGNEKIVVILTRNKGYRKKTMSRGMAEVYRKAYRSYPKTGSGDPDAEFSVQPDDEQDRTDGKGGEDLRTTSESKTGGKTGAGCGDTAEILSAWI